MPQARLDLINQAFDKLDQRYAGFVTIDDLRDKYSVEQHPKYKSGEMTADEVLTEFLDSFQVGNDTDDRVTSIVTDFSSKARIFFDLFSRLRCWFSDVFFPRDSSTHYHFWSKNLYRCGRC
jgi:hypothetical protein